MPSKDLGLIYILLSLLLILCWTAQDYQIHLFFFICVYLCLSAFIDIVYLFYALKLNITQMLQRMNHEETKKRR